MAQTEETVPVVGKGSPAGKRWFVTRFPELSITMKPADIIVSDTGKERVQKPKRIAFMKQMKPERLKGRGYLGRGAHHSEDQGDLNDSHYMGVYVTEDPEILEFLRSHEYYRTTHQDNELHRVSEAKLKELTWDPRALPGSGAGLVHRRSTADLNGDEPKAPEAPKDTHAERPRARVGIKKAE